MLAGPVRLAASEVLSVSTRQPAAVGPLILSPCRPLTDCGFVAGSCNAGSYSGSGAAACTPCALGQAQSSSGQTTCVACDAGRFANTTGRSACALCSPGRATGALGQVACPLCAAGTFSNSTEATECKLCRAGRYAAAPGSTRCSRCSAGHFCVIGSDSPTQFACGSAAVFCPAGAALAQSVPGGFVGQSAAPHEGDASRQSGVALCPLGSACEGGERRTWYVPCSCVFVFALLFLARCFVECLS